MNMGLPIILCLVGIFLKMLVKCQGYLGKLTMVIDVYIFYHYIFMCVCLYFKISDQEKIYRYKFLVFSGALGWHASTPNTPLLRCARSNQSQTQKLLRLALVHPVGLSDPGTIWVWQVLPNRR